METIYHDIYITVLIILAIMLFVCLLRAIRGPRIADRLVAVNMMGTMVMVMISVLALMLHEGYLVDVGLIYAMISFLAVVVLSKVYIGIYEEKRKEAEEPAAEEGGNAHGNS
jgi:multicomponent Na+:H+ antiporter subunit F